MAGLQFAINQKMLSWDLSSLYKEEKSAKQTNEVNKGTAASGTGLENSLSIQECHLHTAEIL